MSARPARVASAPSPSRRTSVLDSRSLLSQATGDVLTATLRRTAEVAPHLKKDFRQQTNETIHEAARRVRERVSAMRHVERSASLGKRIVRLGGTQTCQRFSLR